MIYNLNGGGSSTNIESLTVIQNDTYTASSGTAYSPVTVDVGGDSGVTRQNVNFYDYDGTLLYSYSTAEWANVTELPANPTHSGLTSQGWNYTKAGIDTELSAQPDVPLIVGQMYITDDGLTRLYCRLTENMLDVYLGLNPNGTVTIDWGDESTSTLTGTSLTTIKKATHTYSAQGDYLIALEATSGAYALSGTSYTANILTSSTYTGQNQARYAVQGLRKVELGSGLSLSTGAFNGCNNLETITMPSHLTSLPDYCFTNDTRLKFATVPINVTTMGTWIFSQGSTHVSIPRSAYFTGRSAFTGNNSINHVSLPSTLTDMMTYMFNNCYSLVDITVPSGVTNMGTATFVNAYGLRTVHMLPTTPPTLASGAFANATSGLTIYVPSGTLSSYQSATNWSAYSSYMQEES